MTTQYSVFSGLPTGLTLTKKVFTVADPDVEVTGITGAVTERTNAKGQYTVAVTKSAVITGIHTIILFVGSTPIAIGKRTFAGTDAETATETPPTAALDSADKAALVDLIWDEPLTGATHNVAHSSGKRLRQTTAFQQIDSTVIDASATTTTFVTGLTSSVDNFYNDSMLVFTDGALAGQVRAIYDYVGATKTIILEEALTSAPVNGVAFTIVSLHIHPVSQIQSGLATSATALSTTQWTNTLATDLGTTNTTVATNLNATVSSRSTQTSVDTIDDLLDTEIPALTAAVAAEAVKTSNMQDGIGWLLTERVGAVANPQNAAALCQLTIWGDDYTVQFSGLTDAGVRSTTTLGKT